MGQFSPEPPRKHCFFHQTFDFYDEAEERFIDISPQSNDATVTGPDPLRTETGVVGECAVFSPQDSLEVSAVDTTVDYAELTQTSWFKSERVITSSETNVEFNVTMTDGSTHTLSHTEQSDVSDWQYAAARLDGTQLELRYAVYGEEIRIVDTKDVSGSGDIDGKFNLIFTCDGEAFLDEVRLYETTLDVQQIDNIYDIAVESNAIDDIGDSWDNRGLPLVPGKGNERLAASLASKQDQVYRTLDYLIQSRHINDAAGEQLDRIGSVAGIKRKTGEGDAKYRSRIIGTVSAGRSAGTFEDLLNITALIVNANKRDLTLEQRWQTDPTLGIATVEISIKTKDLDNTVLTTTEIKSILEDAVPGGHDVKITEVGQNPFTVRNDSQTNDAALGLTSDSISTGGTLVSDV